jgi:hypothetical protein
MKNSDCAIKATPEMVKAGLTELFSWALDDSHISSECMSAVYAAMEEARVRGASRKPEASSQG